MTILVPFDGSAFSTTALARAAALAKHTGATLATVTVVPGGREYACERGWIDEDEPLDRALVEERVREKVGSIAPAATVRFEHAGQRPTTALIARRLRDAAREIEATLVVIGSENAGRTARPARSVTGAFTHRTDCDLYLVRDVDSPGPFG